MFFAEVALLPIESGVDIADGVVEFFEVRLHLRQIAKADVAFGIVGGKTCYGFLKHRISHLQTALRPKDVTLVLEGDIVCTRIWVGEYLVKQSESVVVFFYPDVSRRQVGKAHRFVGGVLHIFQIVDYIAVLPSAQP